MLSTVRRAALMATLAAAITAAPLAAAVAADDFLQQSGDMWRASKLVGVNLYGPDKKKVGAISDVLMSKDGKVGYVVVGVGGFLGIGEKDVAIPFDKVSFTQEPLAPAATPQAPAGNAMTAPNGATAPGNAMTASGGAAAPGTAANTGMAPNSSVGLGTPATTTGAGEGPLTGSNATVPGAAGPIAPKTYPDHGMVDYNADQLKAAPTFTYAK